MVVGVWLHVTNTNQWDTNTFTITTRRTILRGGKGIYQRGEERSDILLPRRFWRSEERMSSTSKSNHCPCSDDQSIVQVLCPTGVDDELYVRLDSQPLGKLCLISKLKSHLGPRSRGTCPTEGLLGGARCPSVHAMSIPVASPINTRLSPCARRSFARLFRHALAIAVMSIGKYCGWQKFDGN
jgi:hypothetical protein